MAVFSALAGALAGGAGAGAAGGLSAIAGVAGVGAQIYGTMVQAEGAKEATEASKRAEGLRKVQMEIESKRNTRDIIRKAIIARGEAVSSANTQGAGQGSGLQGGIAGIEATKGAGVSDQLGNVQVGNQMFKANAAIADAQGKQSMGAGISSLGGAILSMQEPIGRLGAYSIG